MAKQNPKIPHAMGDSIHDNAAEEKRKMDDGDSMWSQKGATLSDKSARQEFGLTQEEIMAAMDFPTIRGRGKWVTGLRRIERVRRSPGRSGCVGGCRRLRCI